MRVRNPGRIAIAVGLAGTLAITSASTVSAAPACWSNELVSAAKLRQLDVMLMVGSLRCRNTAHDYRAAYDRFLLRHRPVLGKANLAILSELRMRLGTAGAAETLDRVSVRMANRYGEERGYGCADLHEVTSALADRESDALIEGAEVLVGEDVAFDACPVQVAAAGAPARRR